MHRARHASGGYHQGAPNLGDLLTARPSGLTEQESWAVLCQAVQALQDLFLSDGASGGTCIPLVSPTTLMLSSRGRVRFYQNPQNSRSQAPQIGPPPHLAGYLAPEYRPGKHVTDTEAEKMWIYGLGETLKRATLTSHAATSRLSGELCAVLADMTRPQATSRASLMNLLDVISEYCKKRQQSRPFSHILMDLHQEAMAALELTLDTPWGPPAMPELRPLTRNSTEVSNVHSIPRRWMNLRSPTKQKLTREASTSMEDLSFVTAGPLALSGKAVRPKSMCVPDSLQLDLQDAVNFSQSEFNLNRAPDLNLNLNLKTPSCVTRYGRQCVDVKRTKMRRNPVQRAASRLYRAAVDTLQTSNVSVVRECVGPEFVVRAALPSKQFEMHDIKGNVRKTVTVILLNGQKVDVICNPNTTTAGQLFELIIQKEHIEENFMLGLSALIAGDFVFLPSDTRICKAILPTSSNSTSTLTLFMRVRFFLPSLRGVRGTQARHLLYLQLRRSILEHQLPCSFAQLVELDGLALQAEFGDYSEREHGARDYFLLEHYVPETMSCVVEDTASLRKEVIRSHKFKMGMDVEKAEEDFIILAQNLPHYGGHFYTATWVLKDNTQKDVWLYISAQGINLYERATRASQCGPMLYEMFEWKTIQTLCYSKHYLCILPHSAKMHRSKLKKYKLKMDHKKSYFTFRLASLHHQFFLRLRTEFTSLNSLSMQFGIPLKDMKNETNSLYKLEALTNQYRTLDKAAVNAETEFKIEFRASSRSSDGCARNGWRRSKSIGDFACDGNLEDFQNKENERPFLNTNNRNNVGRTHSGLVLDSGCLSGLPIVSDKRRGVKMGVRAFANNGQRVSRSMEAVNAVGGDDLEQLSLQSVSIHCSTASIPPSPSTDSIKPEVYIVESTIKSCDNQFLPNFQESLSETLLEKLNNISFAEERVLRSVTVTKDSRGSLGMQITEGSDGKVYVQSVILGGPAHLTGCIKSGDQIVAVDGKNLLSLKYDDALALLKMTGVEVEFILSQVSTSNASTLRVSDLRSRADLSDINESHLKSVRLERTMNKLKHISLQADNLEKHVTEDCYDVSNPHKYNREVPYHKHIRYEVEAERRPLNRTLSKSCADINDRAVVVDMIPKSSYQSLTRRVVKEDLQLPPPIALPRSLGLSRKWRGPVKYPVTPVKKVLESLDNDSTCLSTSDEEQVFI